MSKRIADGGAPSEPAPGQDRDTTPPRRRRDRAASQEAILEAARAELHEHGYSKTTIRAVAARAGVTHGLVMRHFGSKEGLLSAAIPGPRDLDVVLAGDSAGLPERIARAFVERMEMAGSLDPMVALIRSAAVNEPTATRLYTSMQEQSAAAYRAVLAGPDIDERVDLLGAVLLGVTFSRYVVRAGPLATMSSQTVIQHLTGLLRPIVQPRSSSRTGEH
ncbi:TetR family transcriptional regulator [Streptomyces sp. NPDC057621]|uniref:TetR/AcrR family transcriptional regulator n=1 Tax=Streptomyces sp. NPDC057621 TaxID=3346186 RepID=UPI0036BA49A2